ncbi:DEAD/DEAH box helicase family protein [Salipaludibacillus aurantiacus]|uniref:Superfamily II DNA or RNA helicase n=1 Tax=Salipaludibacillus aurantiacus TaxID=1601833 RepID=A0A1H9UU77_9BACI|nr:DEAD/DEAH box helicase family protein [Salipaludibacillus aurantiacus]SES12891.1 Superfamily II DNA or RNA helicase [Salipaludibacillus aurantiacus]
MSDVKLITSQLIKDLLQKIEYANTIYILVSFSMKTGVDLLAPALKRAAERGADIKICSGDYMYVTQPEALKNLIHIHPGIEVRLWRSDGKSFHPKAYLIENGDASTLYVGSSNLSASAMTSGVEWNLAVSSKAAQETIDEARDKFMKLFYHEQTLPLNEQTLKRYEDEYERSHQKLPDFARWWTKEDEKALMVGGDRQEETSVVADPPGSYTTNIQPRGPQVNALNSLTDTMEEGYDKAMVVMATGLGKTYLAAFFARHFSRVLFIAHREEILFQAKQSFQHVLPEKSCGIINGKLKESHTDHVFASIFTLASDKHLTSFKRDEFDLIIVDEFHHAAANSYSRALDYFQPKFLLGLTATPDRMDGKDVFALCQGNVAFQMHFLEAIQIGWLAPFHYYGVYDDTDYSQVTWLGTRYDQEELLAKQLKEEMAEKIYQAWLEHRQSRTLAFGSSIRQIKFLADYFRRKGVRAVDLHSETQGISRKEAIDQITAGKIDIIFTVDLFNEGTDIPALDTLLFVRPTESLTIFTQQIGRGLRLSKNKEHCVVIDLIGNYRNADLKLGLLDTRSEEKREKSREVVPSVPASCTINMDLQVVNLLKEIKKKQQPRKQKILMEYERVKEELGYRPTYLQFHRLGYENSQAVKQEFKSYIGFLNWAGELSEEEQEAFQEGEAWLAEAEKTAMSKSYKMVVLQYMLNRGPEDWLKPVTPEEVAPYFYDYLTSKEYRRRIDFINKDKMNWTAEDMDKVAKLIARMPMTKFGGSTTFDGKIFKLDLNFSREAKKYIHKWTEEICEYRMESYFEKKAENMESSL